MTLGFINHVSQQPLATLMSYQSIRTYHPNAPFFLSVDPYMGNMYNDQYNPHFTYNNVEWLFNKEPLGYPPYTKEKVLEWLKRMYIGFLKLGTEYVCNIEDDCLMLSPLTVDPSWEIAGHNITIGNKIHGSILHEIEGFSKKQLKTDFYGAGGGTILKASTFIDNYAKVTEYINKNWGIYEDYYYPQAGYMDCFLVLYYMLCGKEYSRNPNIINLWPADHTSTADELISDYFGQIQLIHNWKFHYQ